MPNYPIAVILLSLSIGVWVSACATEGEDLRKLLDQAALLRTADPDSAIKVLKLAEKPEIEDESVEFFEVLHNLGVFYDQKNMYADALFYLDSAEHVAHRLKDDILLARSYNSLGVVNLHKGLYVKAMENFIRTMELPTGEAGFELRITANTNAGHVSFYQGHFEEAKKYYEASLEMAKTRGDSLQISTALSHIALVFQQTEDYDRALKINGEALSYYDVDRLGNSLQLATLYQNLGIIYKNVGKLDVSSGYFQKSIDVYDQMDNPEGMAQTYVNRSLMWIENGNPSRGITELRSALAICERIGSIEGQYYSHQAMADAFERLNQADSALIHFKRFHELGEEMFSLQTDNQINELRTRFETAEKEKQIAVLEMEREVQEAEIQRRDSAIERLWLIFGSGMLVIALVLIVFFIYRRNQELQRKRDRQKLFAEEMIRWQEAERKRVAGELHDGIGQSLVMVKNHLQKLRTSADFDVTTDATLNKVETAVSDTIQEVRQISYSLRPFQLEIFGLEGSIAEMIKDIEEASGLRIQRSLDGLDGAFKQDLEIHIFRIFQETLQNIVKHAKASTIQCEVHSTGNQVRIVISDNGIGFDVQRMLKHAYGFGLMGLKERAEFLGGSFHVDSQFGQGSKVVFDLPKKLVP